MTLTLALIIIFGVGAGFLVFFVVKSLAAPQKVEVLAGMIKKGKTQAAIKTAKRLLTQDPKNVEAHYYLGLAYHAEGRDELALMEFKAVNQLGLSDKNIPEVEFRQLLAQIFIRYKQGEEALKEYLLLIKLRPSQPDYYYWAGKLFTERNRTDMAANYLRKAAELNPKDGKVLYELGVMLYKDKKTREAKAALEAALKYQSDNAQIHFFLGKIQKDAKDYAAAAGAFEKAARDAEFRIRALVERGGCYMALNAPEKAVPDLERAVNAITDEGAQDGLYARYFLGLCYEKARDLDKAIAQWEKIYAVKRNFRDVGEKLAQYQELRSDDNIKDYLTSTPAEFLDLCKAVVNQTMDLQVQNAKSLPEGCEMTAIENDAAKWRNVRKMPRLIRFYRSPDPVDEPKVRSIMDDAKDNNITRAAIVTSAEFTRSALDYANSRSIELFNKEKLRAMLQGVTRPQASKSSRRP
ncbi:MAG: tetratricopeptide repeat protein [Treponema sp.]|jgi:tetratricopeptide (TPR) repeat protein|nr:tetratricopeptide repeat protein [Treponema sp.]